ncbi:MAG: RNA polymerase factor sigma-54 [Puniceicoccales bacterium]|nr:RNA polymerase factor sigma-54 [Puniceicoccales bacterium]
MDFLLSQDQKQVQKLSPAMRQSLEILQMPTRELWELARKECAKNPTVELDDRRKIDRQRSDDHCAMLENIEDLVPLETHLLQQVPDWSDEKKKILLKLLEFISGRGFFEGDLQKIAKDLHADRRSVEGAYEGLKSLHPHGIGAVDLRECLLLQLEHGEKNSTTSMAKTLVEKHFDDLQSGKIEFLGKKLGVPAAKIIEAGKFIARLNFSPLSGFSTERDVEIIPDLKIFKSGSQWKIEFNAEQLPSLRFTKLYREIACNCDSVDRKTWAYLRKQARAARCFSEAIGRRRVTLVAIAEVILKHQIEFFELGPKFMRPLRLRDVAGEIGLHQSTISRAARGKYVETPHGLFEMAKFFDSGMRESVSQGAILERIREIVHSQRNGLTDSAIAEILGQRGIYIARRTVAKYRKILNLPNSRMFRAI